MTPIVLSLIAATAMVCISRVPSDRPGPSLFEFRYYFHRRGWSERITSVTDLVYVASVSLLTIACLILLLRLIARGILQRRYHEQPDRPVHLGRRAALVSLAVVVGSMTTLLSWPYRIAKKWVKKWYPQRMAPRNWSTAGRDASPPMNLSNSQLAEVLRAGVLQLDTVRERTTALSLLVEEHWDISQPIVIEAVRTETDLELKAMEIRLLGLYRDPDLLPRLLPLLNSPDVSTRIAAIDAVGICYAPGFRIPNEVFSFAVPVELVTNPPVGISSFTGMIGGWRWSAGRPFIAMPENLQSRFWKIILGYGTTLQEREAGARAIINSQGDPEFRVAEWGVWIAATDGSYHLSKSVLEEIPPFVHETGDPLSSFSSYLSTPDEITKPIVHITSKRPLVIDVAVRIKMGRPLYAYPLPDDYCVSSGQSVPELAKMTDSSMSKLQEPRTGYKWISPPHDTAPDLSGPGPLVVNSIGLRWQSLVVSPTLLPWMHPPTVPNDKRYQWWSNLRNVRSCWISSRGETERFLYYDGPTVYPSWWVATLESDKLTFTLSDNNNNSDRERSLDDDEQTMSGSIGEELGLFIALTPQGELSGRVVDLNDNGYRTEKYDKRVVSVNELNSLKGPDVEKALLWLLTEAGLTDAEAGGLIDSWRPQFFQTAGRRFIRLMASKEYDTICPMKIRPKPTTFVRVGLVLSEFS